MTATAGPPQFADGALEQRRLARAGRTGQVERQDAALGQPPPVLLGQQIVLREDLLLERDVSVWVWPSWYGRDHGRGCVRADETRPPR